MSAYTKGPWVVWAEINVRSESGDPVAACGPQRGNDSEKTARENCANARLIAAAPELLESLCELLNCMRLANWEGDHLAEKARAAIAKARGES